RIRFAMIALALHLAGTLMELMSVLILMPIFQFIRMDGNVESLMASYSYWRVMNEIYRGIGLPISLATLLFTSFAFLVLRQGFVYFRLRWNAWAKETVIASTRARAFERYLRAEASYHDNERAGSIVSDLTVDLQRGIDHIFGHVSFVAYSLILIVYIGSLLAISVTMTLIAVAVFGTALLALRPLLRRSEQAGTEVVQANQSMSRFMVERLKAVRLVRLAGMESADINHMNVLTGRQRNMMVNLYKLLAGIEIIMEPIIVGAGFLFIYVSVTSLGIGLEEMGLFLLIIFRLLPIVKETARIRQSIRASRFAFQTAKRRLEESTAAGEAAGGRHQLGVLRRSLRMENVSFAYQSQDHAPALREITVEFPAGKISALVGPSGAGKSTLVDLVPRLRKRASGSIEFDGVSIDDIALVSLRAGIAYVPQHPQIFDVSMIDHIRYGKPDASMDEVVTAAKLAGAHEFIDKLPNKYETLAGEGGDQLSGGQRQRLDLARALVKRAPILLLDEPTSGLDADAEAKFRQALKRIRKETDMTIIIIGHQLSTVMEADRIVVLKDGRVSDVGTHAELIRHRGWYAEAFIKQQRHQPGTADDRIVQDGDEPQYLGEAAS
ncbi:MAG TPA: ABC transporter ATP-binding protein, partial [Hyphomicrobiales bacterium]|nr:ABC transporter ATP-binding protein [Hyphomicrobiales bacterium]